MATIFKPLPPNFYLTLSKLFFGLKKTESWRGNALPHAGFSKEDKEALNALSFVIMNPIFQKEKGINYDMVRFPIFFLKRLFTKYYLWDAKPANKEYLRRHDPNFDKKAEEYVYKKICNDLGSEFTDWLFNEASKLDPSTKVCFDISKDISTLVEFEEIEKELRPDKIAETKQDIYHKLFLYENDFPFVSSIIKGIKEYPFLMQLFRNISWARYTSRWPGIYFPIRCSILTHMMESALLGYFMFIENNITELNNSTPQTNPDLFNALEKSFSVMLFHDVPEIWTDDIPSPAKDGLKIRELTEQQELEALDEYFYSKLPDYACSYFKNGLMLEDESNADIKSFYKSVDYFSADLEVWWNIRCGSREMRLHDVIINSCKSSYHTSIVKETLENYKKVVDTLIFF